MARFWWLVLLTQWLVTGGMPNSFANKPRGYQSGWGGYSRHGKTGQSHGYGSYGYYGQGMHDRLDRIEGMVEEAMRKKSKKHRKASTSSSSSSDSGAKRRKDKKKRSKKSKKDRSRSHGSDKAAASNPGLEEDERKELRELRRQAEIRRIRDEVLAEAAVKPSEPQPQGEVLSPKSRKIIAAESRVLASDQVVQLVPDDVRSWKDVVDHLSSQNLPTVKQLLKQLRPDGEKPVPRSRPDTVRDVVAELQQKLQ